MEGEVSFVYNLFFICRMEFAWLEIIHFDWCFCKSCSFHELQIER